MNRRNFACRVALAVAGLLGVKRLTTLDPILDGGEGWTPLGWIGSGIGPIPDVDSPNVLQIDYPPDITTPADHPHRAYTQTGWFNEEEWLRAGNGDALTQFREAAERYNARVTAFSAPGDLVTR